MAFVLLRERLKIDNTHKMADSIKPDFNVAINFDESSNSFRAYEDMCEPLTEMSSFIKSVTSEDILKKIIQQVLRAAEYVHDTTGFHGNIEMKRIYVANPKILIQSTAVFKNFINKPGETNVISNVYEACESIFRAASEVKISDSKTAEHWIRLMKKEQSIKFILRHPFFWDDEKKLAFICNVAQFVKLSEVEEAIEQNRLRIDVREKLDNLGYQNWINDLDIDKLEDEDQYKNIYGRKLESDTIKKLTNNRRYARYDDTLFSSLLNFIRNHHEHFLGQTPEVHACFLNDKTYGYWKFFTAHRFESLLCDVYDVVSSFEEEGIFKML